MREVEFHNRMPKVQCNRNFKLGSVQSQQKMGQDFPNHFMRIWSEIRRGVRPKFSAPTSLDETSTMKE